MYEYEIRKVRRVVDGDTYDLELDLGFYQYSVQRYRLLGYDTPELRSRDPYERDAAKAATIFVSKWFADHLEPGITIVGKTEKSDSFGRWLIDIYAMKDGKEISHLGSELLENGHAEEYRK